MKRDPVISLNSGAGSNPADTQELLLRMEETLTSQAQKISQLLSASEVLGARLHESQEKCALLTEVNDEMKAKLAEAQHWKDMGVARLGPTFELANHQIDVLRSYVDAMGSPGHRFVTFAGKRLGGGVVGRMFRRALAAGIALKRA